MDLNEKVEQLVQITATLKNEVNELKGKDMIVKVNELEQEHEQLKNDIADLKECLNEQTQQILSLLRQQSKKLKRTMEANKLTPQLLFTQKICEYSKMFPIKTLKDLDDMEELINDNNINELVSVVQQLLTPHGIIKNIVSVLSIECIMASNLDGHHHKRRLLNHKKFMDLLFRAAYYDGYSQKLFYEQIRRALKMVKNRHNKNVFRHRQLQRQALEQEEDQYEEITDSVEVVLPTEVLKTEEIFFE